MPLIQHDIKSVAIMLCKKPTDSFLVFSCYCTCCSVFSLSRPEHTGNDAETPIVKQLFSKCLGKGQGLRSVSPYPAARNKLTLVFLTTVVLKIFFFFYCSSYLFHHWIIYCRNGFWFQPEMLSWALKGDIPETFIFTNLANALTKWMLGNKTIHPKETVTWEVLQYKYHF